MRPTVNKLTPPPEAWGSARSLALRVLRPVERFMLIEASSGLVLIAAAAVALVWANSPLHGSYETLWHTEFTIGIGRWVFERDLHFWINDFLMAIFFLVVGLEIKREIVEGALSELRRAALPITAAAGGMLVPAAIFLALTANGPGRDAWGVPMATDIAFAVGVLTLLGKRVPATLRVLLLALAIIDDIGAIIVIAVFYSSGLNAMALIYVGGGTLGIFLLHRLGVRPGMIFVFPGVVLWGGMYAFGVHPTIAGVIVGLLTPVRPWYGKEGFLSEAREALDEFQSLIRQPKHSDHDLVGPLQRIDIARREAVSPAKRIEHALHPWVAFAIMPIFALANAGVRLDGIDLGRAGSMAVLLGVAAGLAVGKPLGIVGLSWLCVKLGLCDLPKGVTWRGVFVVGAAGGIGFTMAIFIAELAFADPLLLGVGKLGVLIGTTIAALLALGAGWLTLPSEPPSDVANITLSDAEASSQYWTTGGDPRPAAAEK